MAVAQPVAKPVAQPLLHPVATFAATAFGTLDEAIDAVLELAQEILNMGTVLLSEADRPAGHLTVVAVREDERGCGLVAGIEVPLELTV